MLSRQQSRSFDQFAIQEMRVPGVVLMENAGRGCAEVLIEQQRATADQEVGSVVVLAGPGNNGGDGFVIARHLFNAGWEVRLVLTVSPDHYQGDAKTMLHAALRLPISVSQLASDSPESSVREMVTRVGRTDADWIVDAMLGTGATGNPRPPIDRAIQFANLSDAKRLAVDIPSGLDCDTGAPADPTFQADVTCSFIDRKTGFDAPAAQAYLGQVHVVSIGLTLSVWHSG